jgi:Gas vesicle synthesis protein GvpO
VPEERSRDERSNDERSNDDRSNDERRPARRRPEDGEQPRRRPTQRPDRQDRPLDAVAASRIALDALQTMTSRTAEGVIGVERDDDGGWIVVVELLETSRIPATADVLGEYEVEIGPDRALRSYTRRSRYTRASTMSD